MTTKKDNFFSPAENTKPYFKAAIEGFAGSGKTYSAALIAKGLHKKIKSKKPVIIFDTEKAAKFIRPLFEAEGIEFLVKDSKSLADLKETMAKCKAGASDILIIDSISHVWDEYLEAFKRRVNRVNLQFQDWGIVKPVWKKEFSDPFVGDPYHTIMCGRAGYEYSNEMNEDTGKREIYKSGIKMKVEGETAYEPDMLVLMERFEKVLDDKKKVWREGTILKDRSGTIDGLTIKNPSFKDFEPAIDVMLANPSDLKMGKEADTALLFHTEEDRAEWKRNRDRAIEEIEGIFTRVAPGATGKDKQFKLNVLADVFGTTSMTAIGQMKIPDLRIGYGKIQDAIVKAGFAEYKGKKKEFKIKKGEK